MRKLWALALVLVTVALGAPVGILAQVQPQLGTVSGEATDAAARPLVGQQVELVRGDVVVGTTTTGSRGEWSFANLTPGDYVIRINVNGVISGIRVSVAAGQAITGSLIVAPGASATSAGFLGSLGVVGGTALGAGILGAVVATVLLVTGS